MLIKQDTLKMEPIFKKMALSDKKTGDRKQEKYIVLLKDKYAFLTHFPIGGMTVEGIFSLKSGP